jgi:hypothetical protein
MRVLLRSTPKVRPQRPKLNSISSSITLVSRESTLKCSLVRLKIMFDTQDDREVLVAQIDSLRDYIRILAAENAEMKNAEMFLKSELRRREKEIQMIFSSITYQVGRIVLGPALLLRGLCRRVRKP